jgi:hypothetical protein
LEIIDDIDKFVKLVKLAAKIQLAGCSWRIIVQINPARKEKCLSIILSSCDQLAAI